jgi:hypothetical protein
LQAVQFRRALPVCLSVTTFFVWLGGLQFLESQDEKRREQKRKEEKRRGKKKGEKKRRERESFFFLPLLFPEERVFSFLNVSYIFV